MDIIPWPVSVSRCTLEGGVFGFLIRPTPELWTCMWIHFQQWRRVWVSCDLLLFKTSSEPGLLSPSSLLFWYSVIAELHIKPLDLKINVLVKRLQVLKPLHTYESLKLLNVSSILLRAETFVFWIKSCQTPCQRLYIHIFSQYDVFSSSLPKHASRDTIIQEVDVISLTKSALPVSPFTHIPSFESEGHKLILWTDLLSGSLV